MSYFRMRTYTEIYGNPYISRFVRCLCVATLQEMCDHFRVKKSAMVDYVKRHIDEINEGGEHARLARGCWQFDEIAVKRLEKLRGFGISGVMEKVESDEIKELKVTIDNLQVALLAAQQDTVKANKLVAEAEKSQRLLIEKQSNEVAELATLRERTKYQAAETTRLQQELEKATQAAAEADDLRQQLAQEKAAREERDRQLEEIRKASILQRIFSHF